MKNLVIAEFPALKDKVPEVEAAFKDILGDTRAFDGCISLDVYFEEATSIFTLIMDWESFDQYDKYLAWRLGAGGGELFDPLLDGGIDAFNVRKFQSKDL